MTFPTLGPAVWYMPTMSISAPIDPTCDKIGINIETGQIIQSNESPAPPLPKGFVDIKDLSDVDFSHLKTLLSKLNQQATCEGLVKYREKK